MDPGSVDWKSFYLFFKIGERVCTLHVLYLSASKLYRTGLRKEDGIGERHFQLMLFVFFFSGEKKTLTRKEVDEQISYSELSRL